MSTISVPSDVDLATVALPPKRLDGVAHEGQSDAEAAPRIRPGFAPREALEDAVEVDALDARALVGDGDRHGRARLALTLTVMIDSAGEYLRALSSSATRHR